MSKNKFADVCHFVFDLLYFKLNAEKICREKRNMEKCENV